MEIAKQLIRKNLDASYLQFQTANIARACQALLLFNDRERGYLSEPQRLAMKEAWQVLSALKREHLDAFDELREYEKDALFVTDKARSLLEVKSADLDVAGKVALLGYVYPSMMKQGQLTLKANAVDLLGQSFQCGLTKMAHSTFELSNAQGLTISAAVDQKWSQFEGMRASLEKELDERILAYERQLTHIKPTVGARRK